MLDLAGGPEREVEFALIRKYQPPWRHERQGQSGPIGQRNGDLELPMKPDSRSSPERQEPHTFGDLGVLAVHVFLRIRVCCLC